MCVFHELFHVPYVEDTYTPIANRVREGFTCGVPPKILAMLHI